MANIKVFALCSGNIKNLQEKTKSVTYYILIDAFTEGRHFKYGNGFMVSNTYASRRAVRQLGRLA